MARQCCIISIWVTALLHHRLRGQVHRVCVECHIFQFRYTKLQEHFSGVSASTAHCCNVKSAWHVGFRKCHAWWHMMFRQLEMRRHRRDPYIWHLPNYNVLSIPSNPPPPTKHTCIYSATLCSFLECKKIKILPFNEISFLFFYDTKRIKESLLNNV